MKHTSGKDLTTPWNTPSLNATIDDGPVTRKKKTTEILRKAFTLKLLGLCKTRAKKSSLDMFNFNVVLAGHDMVIDTSRATTCRRKIKPQSLQTKSTRSEGTPKNMNNIVY